MREGERWERLEPAIASPFASLAPRPRWPAGASVTVLCLLLFGCADPGSAPPDSGADLRFAATPTAPMVSSAEASPVASLGDVVWATASDPVTNAPQDATVSISPSAPRITAYVLATFLPAGSVVQADWTYNDTTLDAFTRQIIVPTETSQAWLSFHIDRGEAETWPDGAYEVFISLNGQITRQAAVEVAAPA